MPFGYRYMMVYLENTEPDSFLLFTSNPSGSTKLRSYKTGRQHVVGQPPLGRVLQETQPGTTRHECEPHKTDDEGYWQHKTLELNRRFLPSHQHSQPNSAIPASGSNLSLTDDGAVSTGRALRGSRLQLQDYVNLHPDALAAAILHELPSGLARLGARIRWVSPLASDGYREYRDQAFLERVGLREFAKELANFWPNFGPSWDALAVVDDALGKMRPGVLLVEAKSHIPEIYGKGCLATPESRARIALSLSQARDWCGVSASDDWMGTLYQSANRIAHLYFLRERLRVPAWLVNLYFTDDPIGPTHRSAWEAEIASTKARLGLGKPVPHMADVYLPALNSEGSSERPKEQRMASQFQSAPSPNLRFDQWSKQWMEPASFPGPHLTDSPVRIESILETWDLPIPGSWQRGVDQQLLGPCYRRSDVARPNPGEHTIEHEILSDLGSVVCLGGRVVDGINAMPLARDEAGGRLGNVEADLMLLLNRGGIYCLAVCEVKSDTNNSWYAAIECLRQVKLLQNSPAARQVFHHRGPQQGLPPEMPIIGLVLAPQPYYFGNGKRVNVLPHTHDLLSRFTAKTGIEVHLTTWDATSRSISRLG